MRSAQSLLFVINDILDFHQISNGKLSMNFQRFSLWDLIKDVSKLIKFQAKMKNLAFVLENKVSINDPKAFIRSDPNRIKQVLLNLLGNSLKFTQIGSITVSLEEFIEEIKEEKEASLSPFRFEYWIRVIDTGIGIKKEDQANLFKFFGKLDATKDMNKNGIGLGLAISQNFVNVLNDNAAGGEIKVNSEPGRGSCFFFPIGSKVDERKEEDFNSCLSDAARNEVPSKSIKPSFIRTSEDVQEIASAGNKKESPFNILIVDDDQINIYVASQFLKNNSKFVYEIAVNGAHALEMIKKKADSKEFYDLILMDCKMPIMDGFETTSIIRNLISSKALPNLKIIGCTANSSQSDYDQCLSCGMNDYISKPFSKDELLKKLETALEPKKL